MDHELLLLLWCVHHYHYYHSYDDDDDDDDCRVVVGHAVFEMIGMMMIPCWNGCVLWKSQWEYETPPSLLGGDHGTSSSSTTVETLLRRTAGPCCCCRCECCSYDSWLLFVLWSCCCCCCNVTNGSVGFRMGGRYSSVDEWLSLVVVMMLVVVCHPKSWFQHTVSIYISLCWGKVNPVSNAQCHGVNGRQTTGGRWRMKIMSGFVNGRSLELP